MPSLLLQPLVENSIKFAIAQAINGGSITVRAQIEGAHLKLLVADDGPGLDLKRKISRKGSGGVGLSNCRERLKEIYGAEQSFDLGLTDPHGLTVKISLPLELADTTPEPGKATQ